MNFLIFLFLSLAAANARTVDLKYMSEALQTVDAETVVIFDLDNTVLQAVQTLGTDQFFSFLVQTAESQGITGEAAKEWALDRATPIQPVTRVEAVEATTPMLIDRLQRRGITVFALTARPTAWSEGTIRQVQSLGVDFRITSPALENAIPGAGTSQNGVIFLAKGANKGEALLAFLKHTPKKILFIDDKLSNVQSVETALNKTQIEHLTVRYGAADARVAAFDPAVAMCEWQAFEERGEFLSDAECTGPVHATAANLAN